MDTPPDTDGMVHTFCIGQHESKRLTPVTPEVVRKAHESNYDMLTTPITSSHFHSRVLTLLSNHLSNQELPTRDAVGTLGTSQNTKTVIVPPLSPADTPLTPHEAISQVVGITSSWVDLCSPDPLIADISRQVLMLEVAYAAFCGIGYLVIPGPRLHHGRLHSAGVTYYARAIQEALTLAPYVQIHIWMRMVDNPEQETNEMGDLAPFAREEYLAGGDDRPTGLDLFGTWDAWEIIRSTCKYHSRLAVALSLPKHLPPIPVQTRWFSEPVHLLTLEATSFIKNQKGYPVLSKAHQALIARFMRRRTPPWILLCDVGPIPGLGGDDGSADAGSNSNPANNDFPTLAQAAASQGRKFHDPTPHLSYMRNLQQRQPPRTPLERFGTGYQDYLQAPLQPLTVNLESITYEVFEKDPIKYEWYERAIARALRDWVDKKKPASGPDGKVVVAVLGAGRGPLVTRALRASAATGVPIDMWVVEKNPNAFVLLQRHNQNIWGGKAHLVRTDMRSWRGPSSTSSSDPSTETTYPIDILVSELLGSFGDNELSPECLDGATHLLNQEHGISIPASYSAHLTPIAAPKLHADINTQKATNPAAPETPYVVMLHAIDYLSFKDPSSTTTTTTTTNGNNINKDNNKETSSRASSTSAPIVPLLQPPTPIVLPAWSFSHPNRNLPQSPPTTTTIPAGPVTATTNAHNTRHCRLTFPCAHRGVCHGLAGYFETVLYDGVELSTNPVTMEEKSSGMISWFPIFFPLKTPLYVPDNAEVVVTMSRQTDDRKVWYEWMVEVFRLERVTLPASSSSSSSSSSYSSDEKTGRQVVHRRIRVGASELHSSVKDGCLM